MSLAKPVSSVWHRIPSGSSGAQVKRPPAVSRSRLDVAAQFVVFRLAKRRVVSPGETEGGPDLAPDTGAGGDAERLPGPAIF